MLSSFSCSCHVHVGLVMCWIGIGLFIRRLVINWVGFGWDWIGLDDGKRDQSQSKTIHAERGRYLLYSIFIFLYALFRSS